jgi:hypothetical protein
MLSVITNVYKKKTKGTTLMELFTATGKLKYFDNWRCFMCAPRVTRHTSIRYSSSYHTRVNMDASIFFTAAMIRAFRSARSIGNGGTYAGTDHCSSDDYRCTHVACVVRTWILHQCVPCHPWCTHRTSPVVKKKFSFPVAVNNSINVGPLVFLL